MTGTLSLGRLLIVDDNRINRLMLARAVSQLGYPIETAENGREALEKLRAEPFDLILLDIEMPEMDGYEFLENCVKDPELRNIPVIMTTSLDELDSVVRCIELGAEDYLNKPVNPTLLRARIASSLEKKRLRDEQRRLIRTFADKNVADQLMREGFTLGGKHAIVTAMLCDIRNFTTLTEANDPADVIDMINQYYRIVIDTVQGHGGNANLMIGDGLMSFFGAPVFYEDHARRAAASAVEIQKQIREYNRLQMQRGGLQIQVGIGVATGRVVAGYAGTETRATYICVGDTVNLAARLESHTKVARRCILVDEATFSALDDSFETEALGEEIFKGKTVPVKIYAISVP
jgi:class 3 adenylate cyclase